MGLLCVVIPTRNRPEFLKTALQSLTLQSDDDFHVVVADNSDDECSRQVVEEFLAKLKIRYVSSGGQLSMIDNWNFGLSVAEAEYVGVMIDKTAWNPSVISTVRQIVDKHNDVDVISWSSESYYGDDGGCAVGLYIPTSDVRVPTQQFSLAEKFRERREFTVPRGALSSTAYCLGKICFGVYSSSLIRRITNRHHFLFHPITPDYSSLALASLYSENAIQIGVPMQLSFITSLSNGNQVQSNPEFALKYIRSVDANLSSIPRLPIPGLYQSVENCCAFDLVQFDGPSVTQIGQPNLRNLKRIVAKEIWRSGQEIDHSFLDKGVVDEIAKEQRRLDTRNLLRKYFHPTQNALVLKLRSSHLVFKLDQFCGATLGLRRSQPITETVVCSSPETALRLQVESNHRSV